MEVDMSLVTGQVVISLAGHDKGQWFLVKDVCSQTLVTIVNGKTRTLQKPKRKKVIHLQKTNQIVDILNETCADDALIRKTLKRIQSKEEV